MDTTLTLTKRIQKLLNKRIKEEKRLTQRDLANEMNISAASVNRWMSTGAPDIDKLPQLCEILDVTPNELFGYRPLDFEPESYELFKAIQKNPEYSTSVNNLLRLIVKDTTIETEPTTEK